MAEWLQNATEKTTSWLSIAPTNAFKRYHAWKNRPPSERQRTIAHDKLRVVQALIDNFWEVYGQKHTNVFPHLQALGQASSALNAARKLDPNAELRVEGDHTATWTIDDYAAHLLYLEAMVYKLEAERLSRQTSNHMVAINEHWGKHVLNSDNVRAFNAMTNDDRKRTQKTGTADELKAYKNAVRACVRALKYRPNSVMTLTLLAEMYSHTDYWFQNNAKTTLRKAMALDPHNLDVLKLAHTLRVR